MIERTELKNLTVNITDGEHGHVDDDNESNYFLLSNKNIINGKIIFNNLDRRISKSSLDKISKRTKLTKDDVVVSTVGTIGKSAVIKSNKINYDFQRSVGIIKCDLNKILPDYLYYYFNQNLVKKRLTDIANVSIQKCLYISDLNSLIIDYHEDIEDQKKIVRTLDKISNKIDLNNEFNSKLLKIIRKIFNYWFVQFDFPNNKNEPYKSNGGELTWNELFERKIPKGWRVTSLDKVLEVIESGDRPKGKVTENISGIPSIGAENIIEIGKYKFDQEKFVPTDFFNKMKKGIIKSNDVLLYKDGLGVGRVSMFKNNFPYEKCSINSHVFILRSNELISQNYLYFWLEQPYIKSFIKRLGLNSSQPGINQDDVKEIPIMIPNKEAIQQFDKFIEKKVDLIFLNSKKNKQLIDFKNWLLPMLMNGQAFIKN